MKQTMFLVMSAYSKYYSNLLVVNNRKVYKSRIITKLYEYQKLC